MAITQTIANRQLVITVSDPAAARGIRPGMTLTQARALCAAVEHEEHEPHRDAVALEALARWMLRFSPRVFLPLPAGGDGRSEGEGGRLGSTRETGTIRPLTPTLSPAGRGSGLWIDLTGTQRLHGPAEGVADLIASALRRWGIGARLSIGPTPGAAWAGTFPPLPGGERGIHSLRLPDDILAALHHLGIRTIEQLQRLPRDELPARFGSILLTRLDQAMGLLDEPLLAVQPSAPIVAARQWDEPVESIELIWPVARELIDQIDGQLLRRGLGAREVEATLRLAQGPPVARTLRLSRPSRDARKLFDLLQRVVEGKEGRDAGTKRPRDEETRRRSASPCSIPNPKSKIRNLKSTSSLGLFVSSSLPPDLGAFHYNGYVGIRLEVTRWQPITTEQITLVGGEEFVGRVELDNLVERLVARLGDAAVLQARPVQSYLPEKAFEVCRLPIADCRLNSQSETQNPQFPLPPMHLHHPREIRVTVAPSHDRDGRPVQVIHPIDRRAMPVTHSIGPTRVAGQWWTGHDKSRDYFDIELPDGRCWWVFRVNETGRWFWQGEF